MCMCFSGEFVYESMILSYTNDCYVSHWHDNYSTLESSADSRLMEKYKE